MSLLEVADKGKELIIMARTKYTWEKRQKELAKKKKKEEKRPARNLLDGRSTRVG